MSKWGAVHLAAEQVESEVYKFRVQASEYNSLEAQSPAVLASKISEIYGSIASEFHHDSLYVPPKVGDMGFLVSCTNQFSSEPALQETSLPLLEDAARTPQIESKCVQIATSCTIEEYFEQRLAAKLQYWQDLAPKLSRRVTIYEALIVMASVLGTVLGALDQKLCIPFMVAVGAAMNSLMQHEGLHARLAAVNSSIQDLVTIRQKWSASGVVERRTPSMKQWIVDLTEGAVLREAYAYTTSAGPAAKTLSAEGTNPVANEVEGTASPKTASPKTNPAGNSVAGPDFDVGPACP